VKRELANGCFMGLQVPIDVAPQDGAIDSAPLQRSLFAEEGDTP
jgi:hypothetical protein